MKAVVAGNALVATVDKGHHGQTVGEWLRRDLFLPNPFVHGLFQQRRVIVGHQPAADGQLLETGQRLRLLEGVVESDLDVYAPSDAQTVSDAELPEVLYEDDHVLIVNKPAPLLVYPGSAEDTDTLANRVAAHYARQGIQRRVRHVHRLDRDTTGALLYAKHAYSARTMDALLGSHIITRAYIAIATGRVTPPGGTVDAPIGRDRHVSGRYRVSESGKAAVTHYRTIAVARQNGVSTSLIVCWLETGRTHQIRVHLAHLGTPVLGDALYGPRHTATDWNGGQALHALCIRFLHPYMDDVVDVVAPPPPAFTENMERLGFRSDWLAAAVATVQQSTAGR